MNDIDDRLRAAAASAKGDAGVIGDKGIALKGEKIETVEPRPPTRAERRRQQSKRFQSKQDDAMKKATANPTVLTVDDQTGARPVTDPLAFMDLIVRSHHKINAQLLAMIKASPAEKRAELLEIFSQTGLAVTMNYMEAHTPEKRHKEVFAKAIAAKKMFELRDASGAKIKPKDELIVRPPTLILPG